jgi:hypothetical protein
VVSFLQIKILYAFLFFYTPCTFHPPLFDHPSNILEYKIWSSNKYILATQSCKLGLDKVNELVNVNTFPCDAGLTSKADRLHVVTRGHRPTTPRSLPTTIPLPGLETQVSIFATIDQCSNLRHRITEASHTWRNQLTLNIQFCLLLS